MTLRPEWNPFTGKLQWHAKKANDIRLNNISGTPTYLTLDDTHNIYNSTGLVTGGTITNTASNTITVAALTGFLRDENLHTADLFSFDLAETTGIEIPFNTTRWVGVEWNDGSYQVVVKSADSWNTHTEFNLGSVVNELGVKHILFNPEIITNFGQHTLHRLYETEPFKRADRIGGIILGESEDNSRNMTLTAGEVYDRVTEFDIPEINTAVSGSFDSYSSGGLESVDNTVWDNDNYDNSGTLTSMTAQKYANLWFYIDIDGGTAELICVYGTAQYSTAVAAEQEGVPQTVPDRVLYQSKLVGRLIFKKSATTATEVKSVFTTQFSATGVVAHNNLSGLQGGTAAEYFHWTSSDYTERFLRDGTIPMTSDLDMGVNSISNIKHLDFASFLGVPTITSADTAGLIFVVNLLAIQNAANDWGYAFSSVGIFPSGDAADNELDLGMNSNTRFRDLWLGRNLTDGTNTVTIANIPDKSAIEAITGAWDFSGGLTSTEFNVATKQIYVTTFTDEGINTAIDALGADGGIVILPEGEYVVNGEITIDQNNTTLQGAGEGTILKVPNGTNATLSIINVSTKDNCTIRDLVIDGNRANQAGGSQYGIYTEACDNLKILNCTVKNIYGATGDAIHCLNSTIPTNVLIDGCTIDNCNDDGIDINAATHSRIVNCFISNIDDNGIDTEGSEYLTMSNNVFTTCGGAAIEFEQELGVAVTTTRYSEAVGNSITDCGIGIRINSGSHNSICGNTIENSTTDGILLDNTAARGDSNYNTITGNTIVTCGDNGIEEQANDGDYNLIQGNTIISCSGASIVTNGLHTQAYDNNTDDFFRVRINYLLCFAIIRTPESNRTVFTC